MYFKINTEIFVDLKTPKLRKAYDFGSDCFHEGGNISDNIYSEEKEFEQYNAWILGYENSKDLITLE